MTMAGGSFTSGTLDLGLDGNEAGASTWTNSVMTLSNMVPGESLAEDFSVDNAGSVAFAYSATGTASGVLAPNLSFRFFVGGSASNSGTDFRTGTCAGTPAGAPQVLDGTPRTVLPPQPLGAGLSQTVCVIVTFAPDAPSSTQGESGIGTFTFTADQLHAS